MQVTHAWIAWMDEQERKDYWASLLIPTYHSTDIDFDIGWVGMWPDGKAMGDSIAFWITAGGEHQKAFATVVDYRQHALFGLMMLKPSGSVGNPGPVQFSNCTVKEGHTLEDVTAAANQWIAHENEQGIDMGHYMLFPLYGESSDANYSFKWVSVSSYGQVGKSFDDIAGGAWRKSMELFDDLLDCDSARVYHGVPVRQWQMEE